ncbi:uncharacterized protein CANTADRAFT_5188 [Suhomyces tanzawaensis NRRL Y-17324]|uniref:Mug135-like C-terminal domain-containing protein n=1 Tax=Suhomyces tanzawaensis NRRL Y-17324 TaxID=984487 RepID=A0A1E4SNX9_9ASCO|nr:uncharacterized protein CANTADRAFT_5188 [Suhomyces tanzawaensis NRRL Y-17324]ODV81229.1 hypothetical protein CANTADRAFT_5188 [Suhomyces tanzawaensis NRRL Y-17324]
MTQETAHTVQDNKRLSKNKQPVRVVLFPNGKHPVNDFALPPVGTVQDIDSLTRAQLVQYMVGYQLGYNDKLANVRMKEKLKHAVGLAGTYDNIFIFKEN